MTTQAPETMTDATYEDDRGATPPPAPLAVRAEAATLARPDPPAQRPLAVQRAATPGPRTSDATGQLFAAMARASLAFGEVVKTRKADIQSRTRGSYSYKYANLSDVMKAIGPALRVESLVPMQIPMGDRVYVRIVHGPSGEWIEGGLPLALPDYGSDIQRLGSALTYMRRYLLTMMLGIVADDEEDDDGAAVQTGYQGR